MIRWYLRNWYNVSGVVGAAALVVLAIWWGDLGIVQRLMLVQFALINLHFFEEFGFPGGFPMLANKLELRSDKPSHHPLNQATVAFGNNWFALVVYLPAVLFPDQVWLTLGVTMFGFLELIMHSVVFNRMIHHWHNGGLWTSIGMSIASVAYLVHGYANALIPWWAYLPALAWPVLNYLVVFSWLMGKVWDNPDAKYPFIDAEMARFGRWTSRALAIQEAHGIDMNTHTHTPSPPH